MTKLKFTQLTHRQIIESPNHFSIHQLNGMESVLLCSSGLSTSIWSVDEELKLFREISIASGSCRALDWNQNSKFVSRGCNENR